MRMRSVSRSRESVYGRGGDLERDASQETGGRGQVWIYGWVVGDRRAMLVGR